MNTSKDRFLQVINKHQGIIKSLCKAYYTCADDQRDAEQDIILQLWRSFESYRGEALVSTWIYKVGLNTLLSKARKEQRQPPKESINTAHELQVRLNPSDDDLQLLHQLIQSLKQVDKALVILYMEGYKTKEIADLLKLSQSNITTRMGRIKKELKTRFSQHYHELR